MVKRSILLVLAWFTSAGCVPFRTTAPEVTPNVVPIPSPIKVMLGPVQAPQGELCAELKETRKMCVEGSEQALKNGLWKVLLARTRVVERDGLAAEFRLVKLEMSYASAQLINLSMAWQFALRDGSGRAVLAVNETTFGPVPMRHEEQFRGCFKSLTEAVLERVGQALYDFNAAQLQPRPAMPAMGCAPGTTRECTGTGVCRGVQACLPDGSGYEPCDCGTGTRM